MTDTNNPHENIANLVNEQSESVVDILDDLVELTKDDPGKPFEPDYLQALADLNKANPADFQRLRFQLKQETNCKLTDLDDAIHASNGPARKEPTQADLLLECTEGADCFHDDQNQAYADVLIAGVRHTMKIKSSDFERWMTKRYYEEHHSAPNSEAIKAAQNQMAAKACFDGPNRKLFVRVGRDDQASYVDLCDERWRAIRVSAEGWDIIEQSPVRFIRSKGMLPLPEPERGGDINLLRELINAPDEDGFVLIVHWLMAALKSGGPYPALVVTGEQGSAKSSTTRFLRSLVDPNHADVRNMPNKPRELFISAANSHLLCYDNISKISANMSDDLCKIATGGGHSERKLYSDDEEMLFDVCCPMILNGIGSIVSRADLADRSLFIGLKPLDGSKRRTEKELDDLFSYQAGKILGALLDAMVVGLRNLPDVALAELPRMADYHRWSAAWETAFWPKGTHAAAYKRNRSIMVENSIADDPVAIGIIKLLEDNGGTWSGTASELKQQMEQLQFFEWDSLPKKANHLSAHLNRIQPLLREKGITITSSRPGPQGQRIRTISFRHQ